MGNENVIEFPKAQSMRKRLQDKAQEQKAGAILSIASVLIMAVFLNQWLTQNQDGAPSANGNRGIASFQAGSFAKDIKWEQNLAKTIAGDNTISAVSIAESPTMRDELIFGYLEGKYGMKLAQGRIQSLEFIDAQMGEKPLAIKDIPVFLTKYSEAFGVNFDQVSLAQQAEHGPVYSLINADKTIVGQAQFVTDESGRVHSITFK